MSSASDGLPPNPYNPHAWLIGEPSIGEGTWIGAFTVAPLADRVAETG